MGYAARVMRGVIIDYARRRRALKRGGGFAVSALDVEDAEAADPRALSEISDALDSLAQADPPLSEIVDLKFFCGFSFAEIAAMQGRFGAHRAAPLGQGPHLSSSRAGRPRALGSCGEATSLAGGGGEELPCSSGQRVRGSETAPERVDRPLQQRPSH